MIFHRSTKPDAAAISRSICVTPTSTTCSATFNVNNLTPLKLVINSGNGAAGPVVDAIEARFKAQGVPVDFIKIHNTPDGNFPNGIPNPLLPECRDDTRNAVIEHGADMGIAFDGDFDRCFLFDEKGQFIEGYYIVGLLAEAFLEKHPGGEDHPRPASVLEHR
ncbi:phosphomannomutase [Citrobacter koseri]|uniref:Phosphomannomutase n=1 Tax=Citrobacter koseri TaxID=545 RepID=A0A2X2XTM6_CITKO|nr:phosphomannomutase [Citrobacter koseri]